MSHKRAPQTENVVFVVVVGAPLVHQVVSCPFCNLIHVDKGKFAKFNHLKHECFHCGLFFSSAVPCVGVEPVVPKPAVNLATK